MKLLFKKVINNNGEKRIILTKGQGVKRKNELPTSYLNSEYFPSFYYSSDACIEFLIFSGTGNVAVSTRWNIGEEVTEEDFNNYISLIKDAVRHYKTVMKDINELERSWNGTFELKF